MIRSPKVWMAAMTYVKSARTPTLIQHGEMDRRVPIPNADELRQGLEDRGVPVEMAVYEGFGHGVYKPKSQRAVMEHKPAWFGHYIFGEPDLTAPPALPQKRGRIKLSGVKPRHRTKLKIEEMCDAQG